MIPLLKSATALPGYRLEVTFEDGVHGVIDLAYLVGNGVFKDWEVEAHFRNFSIDKDHKLSWNEEIEIDPDSFYLDLIGKTFEEFAQKEKQKAVADESEIKKYLGHRIIACRAEHPYKLWLRYDDGKEGIVDLEEYLTMAPFQRWKQPGFFENVKIKRGRRVYWDEEIDLCPDVLYMKLAGHDYARA